MHKITEQNLLINAEAKQVIYNIGNPPKESEYKYKILMRIETTKGKLGNCDNNKNYWGRCNIHEFTGKKSPPKDNFK